jgi:hypothetical protein
MTAATIVLLHWPILGPSSLAGLGRALTAAGHDVVVPDLHTAGQDHVGAAAAALATVPPDRALLLVAHSGAGHLLPALRERLPHPVEGYVIMDGSLPEDGRSRLDLTDVQGPEVAAKTIERLRVDGETPRPDAFSYAALVDDPQLVRVLEDEHHAQPPEYWTAPIAVFDGWPDAPAGYLSLGSGYRVFADGAEERGWTVLRVDAEQFDPVANPDRTAAQLLELLRLLG